MTKMRKIVITCVIAVFLMPLLVATFYLLAGLSKAREYHGRITSVDSIDAHNHEVLLAHVLPATAKDIVYMVKPHAVAIYVDFTIPQTEFMEWCIKRGWKTEAITREIPFPQVSGGAPHRLSSGLHHEHKNGATDSKDGFAESLEIYYDTRISRCYFRYIRW